MGFEEMKADRDWWRAEAVRRGMELDAVLAERRTESARIADELEDVRSTMLPSGARYAVDMAILTLRGFAVTGKEADE